MPKVPATTYAGPGGCIGPDGALVGPGQPIPDSWPAEVRQSLYDSGGATAQPIAVGLAATGEPELVEAEAHLVRKHEAR